MRQKSTFACYLPPKVFGPTNALLYIYMEVESTGLDALGITMDHVEEFLRGPIFALCQKHYFPHLPQITGNDVLSYFEDPVDREYVFRFYFRNWDFRWDASWGSFVPYVRSPRASIVQTTKVAEQMFFERQVISTGRHYPEWPDSLPDVFLPTPTAWERYRHPDDSSDEEDVKKPKEKNKKNFVSTVTSKKTKNTHTKSINNTGKKRKRPGIQPMPELIYS